MPKVKRRAMVRHRKARALSLPSRPSKAAEAAAAAAAVGIVMAAVAARTVASTVAVEASLLLWASVAAQQAQRWVVVVVGGQGARAARVEKCRLAVCRDAGFSAKQ